MGALNQEMLFWSKLLLSHSCTCLCTNRAEPLTCARATVHIFYPPTPKKLYPLFMARQSNSFFFTHCCEKLQFYSPLVHMPVHQQGCQVNPWPRARATVPHSIFPKNMFFYAWQNKATISSPHTAMKNNNYAHWTRGLMSNSLNCNGKLLCNVTK